MAGALVSWICVFTAVVFFGSNFAVCNKYDAGDGMFFQLILCTGIWMTGLSVYLYRSLLLEDLGDQPPFYPLVMVGGAIWCTGNCFCVFVVKTIGLGPGLVTWGSAGNAIGWLTGFYGLFGLPADEFEKPWLSVAGFVLSLAALVCSTLITRGEPKDAPDAERTAGPEARELKVLAGRRLLDDAGEAEKGKRKDEEEEAEEAEEDVSAEVRKKEKKARREKGDKTTPGTSKEKGVLVSTMPEDPDAEQPAAGNQKFMGIAAALFAGSCFGLNLTPYTYVVKNYEGAPQTGLDYVFNQFCGVYAMSIVWFLVYCAAKKNRPEINPRVVLPGFLSGVMWAIAQTSWFVANEALGFSICFPIILVGPGLVGCMWSVFYFKDIYGMANYYKIGGFFVFVLLSVLCIMMAGRK